MQNSDTGDGSFRLRTECPHCNKALKIRESLIGQIIRCPSCRKKFEPKTLSSADANQSLMSIAGTLNTGDDATQPGPRTDSGNAAEQGVALGRFQLQKVLGEGAFGKVYKAYDPQLDRLLAIKTPKFNTSNRQQVERFLSEARSAAQLRHQNIVPTHESGQIDGKYFIAAQFIDGSPLSAVLKEGDHDRRQAVEWVISLAEAVAYAHARGIVHRDIKPHNVMLDENNEPQLMDFGLAGRSEDESTRLKAGVAVGTPAYMPPEQASGDVSAIGPWSDQYSVGVVLYELLTGQRPYSGDPQTVVAQVLSDPPRRPRSLDKSIPRDLEAICMKAMARHPGERYDSCQDFADDLSRWLRGESTRARPLFVTRQLWRWGKKNPIIFAAGAICSAAVISAACVAVAFALNRDQKLDGEIQARMKAVSEKQKAERSREIADANTKVARQAVSQAEQESQRAAEALRVANEQKSIAEKSRNRVSQLLLENNLNEIQLHKEAFRLIETATSIDSAITVAEEIGDAKTLSGLRCDRQFLDSLTPAIKELDRVDDGIIYPISDRFGIVSADGYTGNLFDLETQTAFGKPIQIPTSDNLKERLIHVWLTKGTIQWAIMVADPSGNYWKHARIHKVQFESAIASERDGPDIQPVTLDSADEVPIWVSADGSTIAWRPREDTQVITVRSTTDMKELCRLKSPEFEFHSAALSRDGSSFAITETVDKGLLKLTLHSTNSVGRKRTLTRQASAVFFPPNEGVVALVEDGKTEVIDIADGDPLAEFPGTEIGILALDSSRNHVACYVPGRLVVKSRNTLQSQILPLASEAIGLEVDTEGRCGILTRRRRLHLVHNGRNHGSIQLAEPNISPFMLSQMITRVAWPDTIVVPAIGLELFGMSENNEAFLASSKTSDQFARVDNDLARYRVRQYRDLSVFRFDDQSSRAVNLQGFNGSVTLHSISTKAPPSVIKAEKVKTISRSFFDRMLTSGDSITFSESGKLAVVRDLETTQRLRLCTTDSGRFYGDFHLTHSKLTETSEGVRREAKARSGPVRFDRSEKMFVYRIDEERLGIVKTETGERTGPTLQLGSECDLLEIGWTLDSSKIWCLTRVDSGQLTLKTFDVVSGEKQSLDLPTISDFEQIEYARFREQLLLCSATKYACIDVIGNAISKQGNFENSERILACSLNQDGVGFVLWDSSSKQGRCEFVPLADSESYSSKPRSGTVGIPLDQGGRVVIQRLVFPSDTENVHSVEFWGANRPDAAVASLHCSDELSEIVFSANGKFAVTTTRTGEFRLWHLTTSTQLGPNLKELVAWPSGANSGDVRRFVFSPDSNSILALVNGLIIAGFKLPNL